jgi:DNA-binding response OmpR family regulator
VTCALSGGTGLELAVSAAFDAILLDLKLPDILGMTVLSELRRLRISVPVLVVTGYFLETDHDRRALQLGAAAFLRKPLLNVEELPTIIRDTVARHVPQPSAPARLPSFGSAPHFTRRQPLPSSICRERCVFPS